VLNLKMFSTLFCTFVQRFMLLSLTYVPNTVTVGKFCDILAAMLDFNFSGNF